MMIAIGVIFILFVAWTTTKFFSVNHRENKDKNDDGPTLGMGGAAA